MDPAEVLRLGQKHRVVFGSAAARDTLFSTTNGRVRDSSISTAAGKEIARGKSNISLCSTAVGSGICGDATASNHALRGSSVAAAAAIKACTRGDGDVAFATVPMPSTFAPGNVFPSDESVWKSGRPPGRAPVRRLFKGGRLVTDYTTSKGWSKVRLSVGFYVLALF